MRAAVWTGINQIEIQDLPIPEIKEDEVLVKVKAAGVCATDVHIITGGFEHATPPHVLGHEIAGVVAKTGAKVSKDRIGERVIINTIISCGKCVWCKSGRNEMCPDALEIGYTPYNGGYEEYLAVPEHCLVTLPDSISFEEGAIVESAVCPAGAIMRFPIEMGSTVFIQGGGPAGAAFLQLAKCCGAGKVIVSVRGEERIAFAKKMGAERVIDALHEDVFAALMEETGGIGAEYSIDAAGTPQSLDMAIRGAANGGDVLLYGIPGKNDNIPFPVTDIVLRQLNIHGLCGNYLAWEPFLQMIESKRFDIKSMVTHRFPLEDLEKAVDLIRSHSRELIKAVIVMEEEK